jgi:hypothetical protein
MLYAGALGLSLGMALGTGRVFCFLAEDLLAPLCGAVLRLLEGVNAATLGVPSPLLESSEDESSGEARSTNPAALVAVEVALVVTVEDEEDILRCDMVVMYSVSIMTISFSESLLLVLCST